MMTMSETTQPRSLVKLGDTDMTVADPAEDVRGRAVIDRDGQEIGTVDALLIDDRESKVRFLQVGSGGFLGLGEQKVLIPVSRLVDPDHVHVDQTRDRVAEAPRYDPDLTYETDYWDGLYGYYGYTPYWAPTYAYPAYPYYRY
jgi:sporulation protein YlmC with PRC-barrel domain